MPEQHCQACGSTRTVPLGRLYFKTAPPLVFQWGCQRCSSVTFLRGWDARGEPTGYAVYGPGQDWRQLACVGIKHGLAVTDKGIVWGSMSYG